MYFVYTDMVKSQRRHLGGDDLPLIIHRDRINIFRFLTFLLQIIDYIKEIIRLPTDRWRW